MPDHMYAMCCDCWELNADDRPAHAEIADDLEEITQEVMLLPDRGEQPADFGQKMTLSHPHAGANRASSLGRGAIPVADPSVGSVGAVGSVGSAVINRSLSPVISDGAGETADTVAAW